MVSLLIVVIVVWLSLFLIIKWFVMKDAGNDVCLMIILALFVWSMLMACLWLPALAKHLGGNSSL